jgi:hypothetical protein
MATMKAATSFKNVSIEHLLEARVSKRRRTRAQKKSPVV